MHGTTDTRDIIRALSNAVVDERRNEADADCPSCGKERKRGQVHFSMNVESGLAKCFVCGFSANAYQLREMLRLEQRGRQSPPPVIKTKKPRKRPEWFGMNRERWRAKYVEGRDAASAWQSYCEHLYTETIHREMLGIGTLPGSKCKHRRLLVPIFDGHKLVCIRGRTIACNCTKWLAPWGWSLDDIPAPYGLDIRHRVGSIIITENPIDALLVTQSGDGVLVGGATLSTSYWRDRWTDSLRWADSVLVAFDNDLPGNGISNKEEHRKATQEWRDEHDGKEPPTPAGVRLANKLREAGVNALLFSWPPDAPIGADFREMFDRGDF